MRIVMVAPDPDIRRARRYRNHLQTGEERAERLF
jgi:hypothetical protein